MSSFADYRIRVIGCSKKNSNVTCASTAEREERMLDI